jgi:hypothetical protein
MKGVKEAFIDAGEISQMLGIGMTKAYAIIKEYNAELEAKGYFTMRGKCPSTLNRKSMVTKIITIWIMSHSVNEARLQKKWIMKRQLGIL